MNCYVCSAELDGKNKTEEHIILNSCGGKLKSSSLICKTCNSLLGERYDATLASQLNFYSNMFNVEIMDAYQIYMEYKKHPAMNLVSPPEGFHLSGSQ